MDWQEEDSAQIALEMGGMSIEKGFNNHEDSVGRRGKTLGSRADSANADSMFAWLSKLLPGL